MKAEIISIGTELLLGEIVNTNAAYLAEQLPLLGFDLYFITTVGDNKQRLINTLKQACDRADIVITTGGLGPTQDDITREAVAEFLQEEITIDPVLVKKLEDIFSKFNFEMSPSNIKQAGIIRSANVIDNAFGSAPGWWIEKNNKTIIILPGPTGELKSMWTSTILPELKKKSKEIIVSRTLKLFNIPESQVDEKVSQYLQSTNPTLATYAKADGIHLRLTAKGPDEKELNRLLDIREQDIRAILEENIWSNCESENIEDAVLKILEEKHLTLATVESATGGLLTKTLSDSTNNVNSYKGGIVISYDSIEKSLNMDAKLFQQYGKISPAIASEMASKIRDIFSTDIGISIAKSTSYNIEDNKQPEDIYIGIDYRGNKFSTSRKYPGQSYQVKRLAIMSALFKLRKMLINGGKHASNN
jgi:nicotinamide-nucleotide amidase